MTKQDDSQAEERRARALAALAEIRRAFAASGVTEADLQAEGRRIRAQLAREHYGTRRSDSGSVVASPESIMPSGARRSSRP